MASRVSISALVGLLSGGSLAILKGHPIGRTAISVAGSCALIGTACFGFERMAHVSIKAAVGEENLASSMAPSRQLLLSHAIGGTLGGAMAGVLFQYRPIPGMLTFAPAMVVIGMGENKFQEMREERLREIRQEERQRLRQEQEKERAQVQ